MTRDEFNQIYLVEPVFEKRRVLFYVYKNDKVDYITPAIDLQKAFDLDHIDDSGIKREIKRLADSFLCKRYGIEL